MKDAIETVFIEGTETEEMLREGDKLQQTITTINGSTGDGRSSRKKQFLQHRFSVNDILSPLNNIG